MAKPGRNDRCPCGSGRKAKRCCGVARGPSEQSLADAFLQAATRDAVRWLIDVGDAEFERLLDGLVDLPSIDLSLQVELPKLASPALERLCDAVAADDEVPVAADPLAADLATVLDEVDTPLERARLARAVIDARDAGRVDPRSAAAALVELASGSRTFLCAALIEAVAVRAGAVRTPAGLVLAA